LQRDVVGQGDGRVPRVRLRFGRYEGVQLIVELVVLHVAPVVAGVPDRVGAELEQQREDLLLDRGLALRLDVAVQVEEGAAHPHVRRLDVAGG